MVKKINYGFAAILLMLAMACNKEPDISCNSPTNDLALSKELIIGKWRLNRCVYFFDTSYVWTPPKSALIDVKFTKKGVVEYYVGGKIQATCRYEINPMNKYTLYPPDSTVNVLRLIDRKPLIMARALENMVPIRVCSDSLFLRYESFAYHTGDRYFFRIN